MSGHHPWPPAAPKNPDVRPNHPECTLLEYLEASIKYHRDAYGFTPVPTWPNTTDRAVLVEYGRYVQNLILLSYVKEGAFRV